MFTKRNLSAAAFALAIAAPLAAQGNAREARRRTDAAQEQASTSSARTARDQAEAARRQTDAVLTRERIEEILRSRGATTNGTSRRIPRGHLPPRGMCRVWVDGVPPGQQPPVTSCAQAERERFSYGANARVIYGDVESFPGRGKGKFKQRGNVAQNTSCVYRDAVVFGDRVINACRDADGDVINRKSVGKSARKPGKGRG